MCWALSWLLCAPPDSPPRAAPSRLSPDRALRRAPGRLRSQQAGAEDPALTARRPDAGGAPKSRGREALSDARSRGPSSPQTRWRSPHCSFRGPLILRFRSHSRAPLELAASLPSPLPSLASKTPDADPSGSVAGPLCRDAPNRPPGASSLRCRTTGPPTQPPCCCRRR